MKRSVDSILKQKVPILTLIFLNLVFYIRTITLYFNSDDYYFISFKNLADIFTPRVGFYHYSPVFWAVIYVTRILAGPIPQFFHGIALLMHIFVAIEVFLLAKRMLGENKTAFIVSALFSFFFTNYEIVYWITGISTSLMVFFYILAFHQFLDLVNSPSQNKTVLMNIFFALALLSHEYALSFPIVAAAYIAFVAKRKELRLTLIPFIITVVFLVGKMIVFKSTAFASIPSLGSFFASIIRSTVYIFLPVPQIIDRLPKVGILIIFLALSAILVFGIRKSNFGKFCYFWVYSAIFLFSITSNPQARYFYLPSIPAIILVILILRKSGKLMALYAIISVISGILFLNTQYYFWKKSSTINSNVIRYVRGLQSSKGNKVHLVVVNLPDSINGPPWNAYVFRGGLEHALEVYDDDNISSVRYVRTIPLNGTVREDPFVRLSQLQKMKSQNIVLIYDDLVMNLQKL